MLRYSLTHRWWVRIAIVGITLAAAVAGLISPFFQKLFVDRLLGVTPIDFYGLGALSPIAHILLAFVFMLFAQGLSLWSNYVGVREGLVLQRDFSEALYKKMLSIRADSMGSTTVGEIVSIYATDVPGSTALIDQALQMGASVFFPLVFAPLAIYWLSDIPLTAILIVMGAVLSMNIVLSTRQSVFFIRFKQLAAERTGIVNEWVQNIRLLRILGWVEHFEGKIFKKREEETRNRVLMVTNGQIMNAFGSTINFVVNLTGVATLIFMSKRAVTPGELFALLWVFGVFLSRPFRQVPWLITFTLDALTSMRRLQGFLHRPSTAQVFFDVPAELDTREGLRPAEALSVRGLSLDINGQQILTDLNFDVAAGEFVAIVGEVGSGKSLLVLSLIGEAGARFSSFRIGPDDALTLGMASRRAKFSFVPQEGFVMSASLRENIAFRYEQERSEDASILKSLERAQFRVEVEALSEGLGTEIGERGVNLSGGQRQRVSLARADHFGRPIMLLDDCLSAVDVDTEHQLLRDLIDGAWRDRTRILITHRLSVLSRVDRIFFLEDGRIVETGTLAELLASSERVRNFVASVTRSEEADGTA